MEHYGFIQNMLDVKVLILYVLAHSEYPLKREKIYELCYQDDKLSYFDVCEALPQLLASGHVDQDAEGAYTITEKGRENGKLTEDTVAAPVLQRALIAVESANRITRRSGLVHADVLQRPNGEYALVMSLSDTRSNLMTLELLTPTRSQAHLLAGTYEKNAEKLYQIVMNFLIEQTEGKTE